MCAVNLLPKLPPGRNRLHRQLVGRQLQRRGDQEGEVAEVERVAVDLQHAVEPRVGHRARGLHRHACRAAPVEGVLHHEVGLGERGVHIAELEGPLVTDVAAVLLVQQGGPGLHGRHRVGDRREILEVDLEQFHGVLGDVPALRDDRCDGLADVADLVHRERVLGDRCRAEVHAGVHLRLAVLARDHGDDSRQLQRLGGVDGPDPRVRHGAAQDRGVQHPRQFEVGDVPATADQQPRVLDPLAVRTEVLVAGLLHGVRVLRGHQ